MARYALAALVMAFAVGMVYGADTPPKVKPAPEVKKTTGTAEGTAGTVDTQRGEQGLILQLGHCSVDRLGILEVTCRYPGQRGVLG